MAVSSNPTYGQVKASGYSSVSQWRAATSGASKAPTSNQTVTSTPTVVTGTGGTRTVNLPSNFGSLSTKEKLDILSGRKDEEAQKKADQEAAKKRLINYSGGNGGGVRLPGNLTPFVNQATGKVDLDRAAASVPQAQAKPTGGLVDIGSGKSNSAFSPTNQGTQGIQVMSDAPYTVGSTTRAGELKTTIESLETDLKNKPFSFDSAQKRMQLKQAKDELDFYNQSVERQAQVKTAAQVTTAIGGAVLAPIVLPALGVGAFGTALGAGVAKATAVTATATEGAKTTMGVLEPSSIKYEDRIKFAQEVDKRIAERTTKEGLDLPFLGQDVEQYTGGLVGDIVYNLPGGRLAKTPTVQAEYEAVLKEAGYSASEAVRLAGIETRREFIAGGFGELVGLGAGAQAVGEISGAATQKALNIATKAGTKTFTPFTATLYGAGSGALGGAVGGAAEGAIIYPFFQQGRRREITPEGWTQSVIFSGASAGVGGAVIGGLITRQGLQKGAYGVGAVLEGGQEYLGDITAKRIVGDVFESGINIKGVGVAKTPTTTNTWNIANIFNPAQGGTGTNTFTQTGTTTKTGTATIIEPITVSPTVTDTLTITKTPEVTPTITWTNFCSNTNTNSDYY